MDVSNFPNFPHFTHFSAYPLKADCKNILNNSCHLIIFQEKKPPGDLPDGWLTART